MIKKVAHEKNFPQVPGRSVNDFRRAAEDERLACAVRRRGADFWALARAKSS